LGSPGGSALDVSAWLAQLGLSEYARAFAGNEITAEVLPHLTLDDLRELGVQSVGHRRRLLDAIAAIAQGAAEDGFAQARQGVDTLISVRAFSNVRYIVYADACARAGRVAEGAEILNVAEHSVTQGDAWLAPEFFHVRGRLRFANGQGEEAARQDFRTALEIAEKQGAQLFSEAARRELAALAIGKP
jgi:hypothetical protein